MWVIMVVKRFWSVISIQTEAYKKCTWSASISTRLGQLSIIIWNMKRLKLCRSMHGVCMCIDLKCCVSVAITWHGLFWWLRVNMYAGEEVGQTCGHGDMTCMHIWIHKWLSTINNMWCMWVRWPIVVSLNYHAYLLFLLISLLLSHLRDKVHSISLICYHHIFDKLFIFVPI